MRTWLPITFVVVIVVVHFIVVDVADSRCPRIKFPWQIYFFLQDILFRADFMFTGRKRINFYGGHFKSFRG